MKKLWGLVLGLALLAPFEARADWCYSYNTSPTYNGGGERIPQNCGLHGQTKVTLYDSSGNEAAVGGGTQYDEDTAHVSGDKVTLAGVVQQTADAALAANGDRTVLQVDANGYLKVNVKAGSAGGVSVTEDAAHVGGESISPTGCRRIDAGASSAGTSGDWATLDCDAYGSLRVLSVDSTGTAATDSTAHAVKVLAVDSTGAAITASTIANEGATIATGATNVLEALNFLYAYNSDSGATNWSRFSHQPLDFDSGGGTENLSVIGIALPASGGPVIGGTASNPFSTSATQSGTWTVQPGNTANTTPWLVSLQPATSGGLSSCYIPSAATTNATNCKPSAGQLSGYRLYNTTTTVYYLRLYNLATAPTCSSATGFIETIPVPPAASAGQVGGTVSITDVGEAFGTGIGFCLTGGGGSTDNTSAASGVHITLLYK